jgi:radical SAM protein with 4Fe4S-binding SPASM domain
VILVLSAPVLYALELTPACNGRCRGCPNPFAAQREQAPLPLSAWRAILKRIRSHAHLVKLTGGEPTLYPEFDGLVALLDELRISFSLFTNGCWADPGHLLAVLRGASCLHGLLISLHGATARAHEAFSGVPGSFARVTANVRQATGAGLPVALSTVLHRGVLGQIPRVLALAGELGVDHVVFNRYLGPPLAGIEPSEAELARAVRQIDALREAGQPCKFGNCIPQCLVPSSAAGCLAGVAYCTVDPWGYMRPCSHVGWRCGSLLEGSVEEAWTSAEMERWRALIPARCEERCVAFARCHGGCRALAVGRGLDADPLAGELLTESPPARRLTLYEGLRPLRAYRVREEAFGDVLMRGNHIVPVPAAAREVLDACDGTHTLRQIQEKWGEPGLRLVVQLAERGMIDFEDSDVV